MSCGQVVSDKKEDNAPPEDYQKEERDRNTRRDVHVDHSSEIHEIRQTKCLMMNSLCVLWRPSVSFF